MSRSCLWPSIRAEVIVVSYNRPEAMARLAPVPEAPDSLGTFSQDRNTINGAWEKALGSGSWQHDFTLTYRRAG